MLSRMYFHKRSINDLTERYGNVSIGKATIWQADAVTLLKITVEALSPKYGRYISSSLPLNDPQRSNLRDEHGNTTWKVVDFMPV